MGSVDKEAVVNILNDASFGEVPFAVYVTIEECLKKVEKLPVKRGMTVRDLIQQEICVDVVDDVCEELWIAMDGPIVLTEEGQRHFADVMEYGVKLHNNGVEIVGIVNVDDEEGVWQEKLKKAREFFESAAGYCPVDEYDKWFVV